MEPIKTRSALIGIASALALLMLYFALTSWFFTDIPFARGQFQIFWYWIMALAIGFGIQLGLFSYIRNQRKKVSAGALAGSGATSGVAMAACCAHHITDLLPLVGLTLAATFLTKYQAHFFLVGVMSNLAGIGYLVWVIKREHISLSRLN